MNWEEREKERQAQIESDRRRYLAMSEAQAESLPAWERYERIRCIREVEAMKWVEEQKKMLLMVDQQPVKQTRYKYTKIVYEKD